MSYGYTRVTACSPACSYRAPVATYSAAASLLRWLLTHAYADSTYAYQNSFYSKTIKDWNNLPTDIIELDNFDLFATELLS